MVGKEQSTQYEEHNICARPCGCYGRHMAAEVPKHLATEFRWQWQLTNVTSPVCTGRCRRQTSYCGLLRAVVCCLQSAFPQGVCAVFHLACLSIWSCTLPYWHDVGIKLSQPGQAL